MLLLRLGRATGSAAHPSKTGECRATEDDAIATDPLERSNCMFQYILPFLAGFLLNEAVMKVTTALLFLGCQLQPSDAPGLTQLA